MKQFLLKTIAFLFVAMLLCSCGAKETQPSGDSSSQSGTPSPEPVVEPVADPVDDPVEEEKPAEISDDQISLLYGIAQPFVERNFYFSSPYTDAEVDWSVMDDKYGNPSTVYHSLSEYREHMIRDYSLSERFADSLLAKYPDAVYEKDGSLYVICMDRGGDITVGNEVSRTVIREGDRIILRVTHQHIDDTSGQVQVLGTFDVDNILIYENGNWVWDDIVEYR